MVPVSKIFGKPDTTKLLIGLGGVLAGVYLLKQTGLFGDTPSEAKKKKAEEGKENSSEAKKLIHEDDASAADYNS